MISEPTAADAHKVSRRRALAAGASVVAIAVHGVLIVDVWLGLSPTGSIPLLGLVAAMVVAIALLLTPLLILSLIPRQLRRGARLALAVVAPFALLTPATWVLATVVRERALLGFSARSAPVVAAIEAYTHAQSVPPESLAQLVPVFLPEIPTPGFAHGSEYAYERCLGLRDRCDGAPWRLAVDVAEGFRHGTLAYRPAKAPATIADADRYGDWSYADWYGDWGYAVW